jgi:hypothetical protein
MTFDESRERGIIALAQKADEELRIARRIGAGAEPVERSPQSAAYLALAHGFPFSVVSIL